MANYSVVFVQPDKVSGERMNVGVICWDETEVGAAMLRNWDRCQHFLGDEMKTVVVAEVLAAICKLTVEDLRGGLGPIQDRILDFIRLSAVEVSALPVPSLVSVLAKSHLKDPEPIIA